MKKLSAFTTFDADAFFSGKKLLVNSVGDWCDYGTRAHLGTRIEVVIIEDRTLYPGDAAESISNRFEKFSVKVARDGLDVKRNDIIELVNPVGKVFGEFRNQLSVTCDDVTVLPSTSK